MQPSKFPGPASQIDGAAGDDLQTVGVLPTVRVPVSTNVSPFVDALAALVRYQLRPSSGASASAEAGSLRPAA